jgi:hypothetical protein
LLCAKLQFPRWGRETIPTQLDAWFHFSYVYIKYVLINISTYLSIFLPFSLSIPLSFYIYLFFTFLPFYLSVYQPVNLSIYIYIYQSIYQSFYLAVAICSRFHIYRYISIYYIYIYINKYWLMIISRNLSPHPVHALSATFCRHCLRPRRTCQERQWEQRSRWWRGRTLPSSRPTHTHIRPRSNDKSVIPMNIANRESTIIIYEHLQNNMGKTCDMLVSMCEGWFWFLM